MAEFSLSEAYGAGFRLISRAPMAPLVWGVVSFLATLPFLLLQSTLWPSLMGYYGRAFDAEFNGRPTPSPNELVAAETAMNLISLPMMVVSLLVMSVVFAAVMRLLMEPQDSRFFYLRLGKREVWLALSTLVVGVLAFLGLVIVMVLSIIPMVAFSMLGGIAILLGVVGMIAVWLVGLYFLMRLSMAPPMSFAERKFMLFESWKFTAGQGRKLLGLGVLVLLTVIGLQIVLFGIGGAVGAIFIMRDFQAFQEALTRPETWAGAYPYIIVGSALYASISGYLSALLMAPFADAYRQMAGPLGLEDVF